MYRLLSRERSFCSRSREQTKKYLIRENEFMLKRKFYEATEVEIISVQAENIIVTSTPDGNDSYPDSPNNWGDITNTAV